MKYFIWKLCRVAYQSAFITLFREKNHTKLLWSIIKQFLLIDKFHFWESDIELNFSDNAEEPTSF